eukprot:CAMPEP_0196585504 /NCGR_PEP_ID=MMETSP1081-20130531/50939_1 /TAXON_ID=36882 /ORGANISM="Pyramimonas amylifera, Strain CCMP720" /LENGTH=133 /DNA_ID=CAMNT_0041907077 /DNA_START=200 /DNA_END=601 /DNA_ORIENTATION=-
MTISAESKNGKLSDTPIGEMFSKIYKPATGYRIKYGVFTEKISEIKGSERSSFFDEPSEQQVAERQREAAEQLVNINQEERDRRSAVGSVGLVLTAGIAAFMLTNGVDGLARASIIFPLNLSLGFLLSGATGL